VNAVILGSTGQLGSACTEVFRGAGVNVTPLSHAEVEIADGPSVRRALEAYHPDVTVNCAAYVRVNDAEDHIEDAFRVNALGALHVAQACAKVNSVCVYISTDFVFDGTASRPYTEEDVTHPINVYGTSKLAGELLVRQACPRWLIARVASLFGEMGSQGKGGNFVDTIVRNGKARTPTRVVNDVRMSPTYARDAAKALAWLLSHAETGVFHLTNAGSCTWFDFARRILELSDLPVVPEPISSREYPTRAPRPLNSSMNSTRLPQEVRTILRPWEDAVAAYLEQKGHAS
jgi:dTDP-4-dehydrorhamnose reductase